MKWLARKIKLRHIRNYYLKIDPEVRFRLLLLGVPFWWYLLFLYAPDIGDFRPLNLGSFILGAWCAILTYFDMAIQTSCGTGSRAYSMWFALGFLYLGFVGFIGVVILAFTGLAVMGILEYIFMGPGKTS